MVFKNVFDCFGQDYIQACDSIAKEFMIWATDFIAVQNEQNIMHVAADGAGHSKDHAYKS